MPELFQGYCIDTAPLIDLYRRKYPPDIFPGVLIEIETLVKEGVLVAPRQVLRELEDYEERKKREEQTEEPDKLLEWAKRHKKMFINPDESENNYMGIATQIINEIIPGYGKTLVDEEKEKEDADPFVIALAKLRGWVVINSESSNPPNLNARPKIPDVCAYHKVECIDLLEFFRRQKWVFRHQG
ncbi:hypothetical protein CEE36_00930 [candidate division TA06 bacterium B3_TA06]|uniref:DUF4411 domain-containing protein n=1 Tax=candidate division TA06 bacterium B3_TA06 TaxID=2012487 RepID=A0A532VAV7_UNCT6|nr:MAG: hypothetical protein CEE36_00930 [candidate division TA06 bacterium B3_TA06]